METSTVNISSYTFKEKYFQVKPEWRIRRYQFFVRSLIPAILLWLFQMFWMLFLVTTILGIFGVNWFQAIVYISLVTWIISSVISFLVSYYIWIPLATKRCQDFGSDGRRSVIIIKTSIAIQILTIIIFGLQLAGVSIPWVSQFLNLAWIMNIIYFILFIILLFRPGNKWDNAYGMDPINTKVSFLG